MPSRVSKYHNYDENKRTERNKELYKTIYDDVEYSNVEGISIIEKNEKIDIEKIRELINGSKGPEKPKEKKEILPIQIIDEPVEKSYDIRDVLNKAKTERTENTQYDILKGINANSNLKAPDSLTDEDLKKMIETITKNSKSNDLSDELLDDLKTTKVEKIVEEEIEKTGNISELDKSFFTSSLGFTTNDFEDLKEMKDDIKKNNILTRILLFVFLVVLLVAIMFFF